MLLPRAQGLPQPPGADQHLRQDGPQGASTSPSKTTLIMLIGTARPGHPRRDDRSRHIHPRRRQQDTLRVWVRRRSGVKENPRRASSHIASVLAFSTLHSTKGGLPALHTRKHPLMASDSHCNIFCICKKGLDAFFSTGGWSSQWPGVPGFARASFCGRFRAWQRASAVQSSSKQHRAAM